MTVQWPDVQFTPAPITLPPLPRFGIDPNITLPQLQFAAPRIPVIPSPPNLPTLPELPQLNLPQLPDLPPPPTLPELPGEFTAVIDVLQQILRIYCIIKLGFLPTDEFLLKTKIEEITARGLTPLIPLDLLIQIEPPTINIDYVDAVKITGYTNLELDFSGVQDAVEAAAQEINNASDGISKGLNKATKDLSKALNSITNPKINIGPDGVSVNDRDLLNALPEDLSEQEKLHALLLSTEYVKRVAAMQQSLETYERQLAALPETVKLEAASVPYVPGEHQPFITDSDIILPFQKRLKEYRDRLAQHIDATEEMSERNIANSELGEIGRFLAQQRSPFVHESLRNFVAGTELKPRDYDGAPVKVGELDFEAVEWVDESDPDFTSLWPQENEAARRIAQVPQPPDYSQFQAQAPGGGSDTGSGNIRNIGIFTVDNSGQSRRIVSYTLEAESQSVLADIDLDNDGDNDKVYTYGPNVYLKRNDRVQAQPARAAFRPEDIEFWRLAELVPAGMSPNFPEVNNELVHEASFSFDLAPMDDVVGYEVVSQNSASTIRTFLVPEESAPAAIESDRIRVEEPDGEVLANNAAITENVVRIGDFVATGNNSSVRLVAADGTTLRLAENTGVSLDPTGIFELRTGSLEIDMPPEGSALFPAGTKMQALAGSIRIRFFDGSTVVVEANRSVTLPDFSRVAARVERASGTATITSAEREIIRSSRDAVRVKAGEVIHALQVARVQWNIGAPGESEFTLSPDVALPVPDALGEGIDIRVESGSIEVIRSEQREQEIQPGMLIDFGDRIQVGRGSARLQLVQTGPVQLGRNETFVLQKMPQNNERPSVTLQLDPAFYQSQLFAFDAEGNRSTGSEPLLLSPQVCGDTSAPFANLGKARFTVAVGKTLPLDASRSFDGQSNIISYWLDTDATVDSDGDGTANNDRNAGRDTNTAVDSDEDGNPANDFDDADFTIGPFAQVGTRNMRLTVRDEALNEGYQDIIVDVVEPRIVLNPEPLKSNIISGFIEPAEEDAPISIFRLRSGENSPGWELLTTPSANENSQYLTDEEGRFSLQDLDQRDRLVVRDQQGEDIAEINRETGRIVILNPEYEARVLPAGVQTRIGIFRISDILDTQPVTFVYFVPDVNLDVILDAPETVYDLETVRDFVGVHMRELPALAAAGLRTRILPGDDPEVPGAGVVLSGTERLVTVDINGDIRLHSSDLTLTERPGGFYEPVVFELRYLNELIAEVYIATTRNFRRLIEIVDAPAIVQTPTAVVRRGQATGSGTASGGVRRGDAGFSDVQRSDPLFPILNRLKRRGIVAGVGSSSSTRGELFYEPDRLINRAEFTQVTEKALCIVPRPEAFELPSPFFDVINEDLWFYPVLKEGNIRGFIRGYIGEARTESDGRTTTPFRPANPITRAEAATIVLAALQEQNIIDFSNVSLAFGENENWYDPFIRVALDLEPYLIDEADSATRAFLITPEEAQRAEEQITRRDFAVMVDRVLLLYDCYDNDSDNDGLPDRWELEHGVDDPNADPDGDQCTNQREFELDTNPNNPDTDGGGTPDCREDETGTNPLSPYDDFDGLDGGREDGADNAGDIFAPERIGDSDPGVFVVRPPCTQCPCQATIAPGEDLQPSDIIFAGLTGPNGLPIYTKSNEERY
ncbi:hypothetical protein COV82_03695 [Candidatus Peregrinibacteria bacterium CG11_big_fil_rev_8_21_14_0_20_46_8]|nr:MAG: hypothetical protein COV82_03695 [Candidatus Peregrinibacteria bacterium CG11_big_fil_rev_8_21_14_0_20_46_8]